MNDGPVQLRLWYTRRMSHRLVKWRSTFPVQKQSQTFICSTKITQLSSRLHVQICVFYPELLQTYLATAAHEQTHLSLLDRTSPG